MPHVPTATAADTLRAVSTVVLPVLAKGPIIRRPRAVTLAERLDADSRAVAEMQRLRDRYGPGPLQVRLPGRRFTFVLDPGDVHRVLNETPSVFTAASREKRGALNHFQPEGLLVSSPEEREHRRPFNEAVLQAGQTVHRHGEVMAGAVEEEVAALLRHVDAAGVLDWEAFATMWWRLVRRVVLGASARNDQQVTDDLQRLRFRGNLSFLSPRHRRTRQRFLRQVEAYVARAEPGSLAQMVADTPAPPGTEPHQQVPQWLFAFDAAAWAGFRALALLTAHPGALDRAREEVDRSPDLPYLRAALLESVRLWPTTPLILRDSRQETTWSTGTLPAGASVVVIAPFFHRDDTRVPEAHRYAPDLWLRERSDADWPLVPFSGGPAMCPGRNVTLLVASTVLAQLLRDRDLADVDDTLTDLDHLPGTLSPFTLRFAPSPRP